MKPKNNVTKTQYRVSFGLLGIALGMFIFGAWSICVLDTHSKDREATQEEKNRILDSRIDDYRFDKLIAPETLGKSSNSHGGGSLILEPVKVELHQNNAEIVDVARNSTNIITSPFKKSYFHVNKRSIAHEDNEKWILLDIPNESYMFSLAIFNKENRAEAILLNLLPKNIPGKNITISRKDG